MENKRKLASVQVIKDIQPIPNADFIEVAQVNEWKVVVKKGDFEIGDKIVYFEIDSFLPNVEEYAFLKDLRINPITKDSTNPQEGYRIRTIKLRKQISQGLILPFEKVNTNGYSVGTLQALKVGEDLTDLLGITKWEKPEMLGSMGTIIGGFPEHLTSKTDEERVQNYPDDYKRLLEHDYFINAKYDRSSTTIIYDAPSDTFRFASRSNELKEGNIVERVANDMGILDKIRENGKSIILQSEIYGEGIQSNPLGIRGKRLATFNIEMDGKRLGLLEMLHFVKPLNLEIPEIMEVGSEDGRKLEEIKSLVKEINATRKNDPRRGGGKGLAPVQVNRYISAPFMKSVDDLLALANECLYVTNDRPQEGVVVRTLDTIDARNPISFKAISNKFILKYDK